MNLKCSICLAENQMCDHVAQNIGDLIRAKQKQAEELKALANTWKGILKVLDLENANGSNIFLKIPKLIAQIQRKPEMFNFISPEINAIIEKHADK